MCPVVENDQTTFYLSDPNTDSVQKRDSPVDDILEVRHFFGVVGGAENGSFHPMFSSGIPHLRYEQKYALFAMTETGHEQINV